MARPNRRTFLKKSAAVAGAAALSGPFQGLLARAAMAGGMPGVNNQAGYGPLSPVVDPTTGLQLLDLPQGFEYRTFGEEGTLMDDGRFTPGFHDGMMSFPGERGSIRLVRNHETRIQFGLSGVSPPPTASVGPNPYDPVCTGGTTTIEIGRDDRNGWGSVSSWSSASGTYFNCSGGNTSYGTWVTCEEIPGGVDLGGDFFGNGQDNLTVKHGYIYEVDPRWGPGECPTPQPIRSAGRFTHEGAVMDNATGYLYMTQDDFFSPSGLFRYIPPASNKPHRDRRIRDGGRLQMLRVPAMPLVELFGHQEPGAHYMVDWVDIADPDPTYAQGTAWLATLGAVSAQGFDQGAAKFSRLEGIRRRGRRIYFTSTQGGQGRVDASSTFGPGWGQIWRLDLGEMSLHLVFEAPPTEPGLVGPENNLPALSLPDNLAISPRGTLVLCEDGTVSPTDSRPRYHVPFNFLRGLTKQGQLFDFAKNLSSSGEFTGATFSPNGKRLFVNTQTADDVPGRTYEIRGPFANGPF